MIRSYEANNFQINNSWDGGSDESSEGTNEGFEIFLPIEVERVIKVLIIYNNSKLFTFLGRVPLS